MVLGHARRISSPVFGNPKRGQHPGHRSGPACWPGVIPGCTEVCIEDVTRVVLSEDPVQQGVGLGVSV